MPKMRVRFEVVVLLLTCFLAAEAIRRMGPELERDAEGKVTAVLFVTTDTEEGHAKYSLPLWNLPGGFRNVAPGRTLSYFTPVNGTITMRTSPPEVDGDTITYKMVIVSGHPTGEVSVGQTYDFEWDGGSFEAYDGISIDLD